MNVTVEDIAPCRKRLSVEIDAKEVDAVLDGPVGKALADKLFEDTDLLIAQEFMPTDFDWRVGVLEGEPLFVCQYQMARGHWQIIKHGPNGAKEGGFRTLGLAETPPRVIEAALAANFSAAALDAITVPASGINSDIHADADYRAHLIGVLAKRAVAAAG